MFQRVRSTRSLAPPRRTAASKRSASQQVSNWHAHTPLTLKTNIHRRFNVKIRVGTHYRPVMYREVYFRRNVFKILKAFIGNESCLKGINWVCLKGGAFPFCIRPFHRVLIKLRAFYIIVSARSTGNHFISERSK